MENISLLESLPNEIQFEIIKQVDYLCRVYLRTTSTKWKKFVETLAIPITSYRDLENSSKSGDLISLLKYGFSGEKIGKSAEYAAKFGHINVIIWLKNKKLLDFRNIYAERDAWENIFYAACEGGQTNIINYIPRKYIESNINKAIKFAAMCNTGDPFDIINQLLNRTTRDRMLTISHWDEIEVGAATSGNMELYNLAIENNAETHYASFLAACKCGHLEIVTDLLEYLLITKEEDQSLKDELESGISLAIKHGRLRVVQLINDFCIQHAIAIKLNNMFHLALISRNIDLIKFVLNSDDGSNFFVGPSCLELIYMKSVADIKEIEPMIKKIINPKTDPLLSINISLDTSPDVLQYLIEKKKVSKKLLNTWLNSAAALNLFEIVEIVIKHGATNIRTAMESAKKWGNVNMVTFLLSCKEKYRISEARFDFIGDLL